MNRTLFSCLCFFGAVSAVLAQAVSNVRVDVDTQRVKIQYDAVGLTAPDSVSIRVEKPGGIWPARTVTGDVGRGVAPGLNKTIFWDYRLDGVQIADSIRVTVLVKRLAPPVRRAAGSGGPANALLSALLPGVGTIFVQPNRKIGARPLISVGYVGLLAYGFSQRSRSRAAYDRYETGLAETDYQDANQRHHRYLVATRAAAVLWLSDVAYTFFKGRKNERERRLSQQRLSQQRLSQQRLSQQRLSVQHVAVRFTNDAPVLGFELHF